MDKVERNIFMVKINNHFVLDFQSNGHSYIDQKIRLFLYKITMEVLLKMNRQDLHVIYNLKINSFVDEFPIVLVNCKKYEGKNA